MRPYRQLDHTSDLKVEIYGSDLPELLENACSCMFDVMLDRGRVDEVESIVVRIESPDEYELFLDWLREVLFLFSSKSLAVARVDGMRIETGPPCRLTATLHGETFDPARHELRIEIKTPTYHEFALDSTPNGLRATVVLDV